MRADARLSSRFILPMNCLLLGEVRQHALDRDDLLEALESGALGAEHLRHAARSDPLEDLVALGGLGHRKTLGAPEGR